MAFFFGLGLFTVHRAWGDPFFLVVERFLGIINLNRSSSTEGTSLAFNILPGLVGAYFLYWKMPIADNFLNGLLRVPVVFADDRSFPNSINPQRTLVGISLISAEKKFLIPSVVWAVPGIFSTYS